MLSEIDITLKGNLYFSRFPSCKNRKLKKRDQSVTKPCLGYEFIKEKTVSNIDWTWFLHV